MAGLLKLRKRVVAAAGPPRVAGPYRAAHTPGKPDCEWEVRDGDGILIVGIVAPHFDQAKERAEKRASELNEAWQRGRASR